MTEYLSITAFHTGSALFDSLTTLESLALEVSYIDREELLEAIFANCHVIAASAHVPTRPRPPIILGIILAHSTRMRTGSRERVA